MFQGYVEYFWRDVGFLLYSLSLDGKEGFLVQKKCTGICTHSIEHENDDFQKLESMPQTIFRFQPIPAFSTFENTKSER